MASEWYYTKDEQQHGPVSSSELKELAASGRLQATDLVWKEGLPEWVAAYTLPGLALASPTQESHPASNEPMTPQREVVASTATSRLSAATSQSVVPAASPRKKSSRSRLFIGIAVVLVAMIVVFVALSGKSLPPNSNPRIVGTWVKQKDSKVALTARFTEGGALVVNKPGYKPAPGEVAWTIAEEEETGSFSADRASLMVLDSGKQKGKATLDFVSDDEMVVGNLDPGGKGVIWGLAGTWRRVKNGQPVQEGASAAQPNDFFDKVKGEWVAVSDPACTLTISQDAVTMNDGVDGSSPPLPYKNDAAKKSLTFQTSDKESTVTAKLGDDGRLTCSINNGTVIVMRRKALGEGLVRATKALQARTGGGAAKNVDQVRLGMTPAEVKGILGEPDYAEEFKVPEWRGQMNYFRYGPAGLDSTFVHFGRDGRPAGGVTLLMSGGKPILKE